MQGTVDQAEDGGGDAGQADANEQAILRVAGQLTREGAAR